MGLAASQARYLEITARKINVEYEGQQINQQRTELANQSAGLFTQLMDLQVPTAPSTSDYSQTIYTFNDGANACTITDIKNLNGDPDYNANVTYYYTETIEKGIGKTRSDLGVKNEGTSAAPIYWLTNGSSATNKTKLAQCSDSDEDYEEEYDALLQICKDNPTSQLAIDLAYDKDTGTIGNVTGAYRYKNTNGVNYYYSSSDLATASGSAGSAVSLTGYYSSSISQKVYNTNNAYLETTDTGRYADITLKDYTSSFNLAATTTTDSNAYSDAVNEYEYQQNVYQQRLTEINARTSIIQQEDKTLELKLSQLDTEQQALATELESVKKVIEKNISETFKTFSS